ncbi:MAG: haloacid dehalogenase-like hydrolase [Myxococcota bacterium]
MNDILDALDALPPGEAVFDLDGTLIHHDIGEATLRRLIARGPLPAAATAWLGTEDPWGTYVALNPVDQCVAAAVALAGLDRAEVELLVDQAFAAGEVAPNAAVCELAAAIGRRHRVWILTGSAEVLGEAVAARVGIRHVRGVRLVERNGIFGDKVTGIVSCAEGKVRANWVHFGRRPVFAIGDSPWDLHLLRLAHVARTTGRIAGMEFPAYPVEPPRAA